MCVRSSALIVVLACGSIADAGLVRIELVPDIPYPQHGQYVTVDVYLHDTVLGETNFRRIALDFSRSDPMLVLDPEFVFDYSTLTMDAFYWPSPGLPYPSTTYSTGSPYPGFILTLPQGGSLHRGSIGVTVPMWLDDYLLDVVNRETESTNEGARFDYDFVDPTMIHSATDEISGGTLCLGWCIPEPSSLALLIAGSIGVIRIRRG